MSNANKVARYLTTIDSAPSYAINILVAKPITVSATFFFFIHSLLPLSNLLPQTVQTSLNAARLKINLSSPT